MSILDNAVQAITCGIEDFQSGSDARLKSSIRNVHAGVLLLFKEKLSRLSAPGTDEALIKQRIIPELVDGVVVWKGKGKNTVDVQNIKERFKALAIQVDWEKFDKISDLRNDIEHYFTKANTQSIQEALAKSFALICDFLPKELGIDAKKKIGDKLWSEFIEIKEVYESEKARCEKTYKNFECESEIVSQSASQIVCDDCGSDLIRFKKDGSFECRACGESQERERLIGPLVEAIFDVDNYIAAKENCDPKSRDCPECGEPTFVVEEMICANCGEGQRSDCARCSSPIPVGELGGEYCGYCAHMLSKDD